MKRDIGFAKIRRRCIARAMSEEGSLRGREGIKADEKATSCQGKERFESHAMASVVVNRKKGKRRIRRKVYACRDCRGFHIGSTII